MKPTIRVRLGVVAAALWIGLGAVLFGVGGDGYSGVSLSGAVTVEGVPLEHGTIFFLLTSPPSVDLVTAGTVIERGRFKIRPTDPLVPGTYHVRISGLDSFLPREMNPDSPSLPPDPVPECYNSKSVLEVVIPRRGTNILNFDFKR